MFMIDLLDKLFLVKRASTVRKEGEPYPDDDGSGGETPTNQS